LFLSLISRCGENTTFLDDNQKYNDDKRVEKMNRWDSTKQNHFIQTLMKSKLLSLENKLRFPDYKNKQGMNELVFESGELFINSAQQSMGTSYIKRNIKAHSTQKPNTP